MTSNPTHSFRKSRRIADLVTVFVLARVETECLLIDIAEEMKGFNGNIRSAQLTFQKRPEVFDSICVNCAVNVVLKVIDDLVHVVGIHSEICGVLICVENRASVDAIEDGVAQCYFATVRNNASADLAITFQHPHDDRFAPIFFAAVLHPLAANLMHVARLATDESLINFNFRTRTTEFHKRLVLKSKPKALQHKPCRLLGDAKRSVNLHTGDAILAIDKHPESSHPLVQAERRILKDCADLHRELLIASTAEPDAASLNKVVPLRVTARTNHLAIRPTEFHGVVETALWIGEVNDRFL